MEQLKNASRLRLIQLALLTALVGLFVLEWEEIVYYNNPVKRVSAQNSGLAIMYSTADCVYCVQIREIFADKKFPYVEYDIDKNSKARSDLFELGGKGVPLLVVNGEVIPGFNVDRIVRIANSADAVSS